MPAKGDPLVQLENLPTRLHFRSIDQRIQLLASQQFAGGRIATVEGLLSGGKAENIFSLRDLPPIPKSDIVDSFLL
jgi:hypothetical protein